MDGTDKYSVWVEYLTYEEEHKQYRWKPEYVTVNFDADKQINELNVISDMSKQPGLVAYYGEILGMLKEEVARKVLELDKVRLQMQALKRTELEAEGKRATKDALEEYVITRQEYQSAVHAAGIARFYYARAATWFKAIEQKKDLLVAICYRQNVELKAL